MFRADDLKSRYATSPRENWSRSARGDPPPREPRAWAVPQAVREAQNQPPPWWRRKGRWGRSYRPECEHLEPERPACVGVQARGLRLAVDRIPIDPHRLGDASADVPSPGGRAAPFAKR